jgi:hypothetical protein
MSHPEKSKSFLALSTTRMSNSDMDEDPTIQLPALSELQLESTGLLSEAVENGMDPTGPELGDQLRMLTAPAPPLEERLEISSPAIKLVPPGLIAGWRRSIVLASKASRVVLTYLQRLGAVTRFARGTAHGFVSGLNYVLSVVREVPQWLRERTRLGGTKVLRFRLSDAELAIVTSVANRSGCQPRDIVRAMLLEQYRGLVARRGEVPAKGVGQDYHELELAGVRRTLVMPPHE